MLELELKYIEITREIVLKRAENLYEVDSKYCIKMFDLGLEQLKVNFEMQQEHNRVKHQKVSLNGSNGNVASLNDFKQNSCAILLVARFMVGFESS